MATDGAASCPAGRSARGLLFLVVLLILGALAVVSGREGPPPPSGSFVGLEYADLPGNAGTVDLYLPADAGLRPVIMWTAGSGWAADNGNVGGRGWADALLPEGYAVAAIAVRASGQAQFPAQIHDAKAAVRWLRAHADEYGLDPDRIAVMGNSSGGHVASVLGVTGGVEGLEGNIGVTGPSSDVQAAVSIAGPTDLAGGLGEAESFVSEFIGCAIEVCLEKAMAAAPTSYVTPDDPPVLLIHGTDDAVVPFHHSELLFGALADACVDAALYAVVGGGHDYAALFGPDVVSEHARVDTQDCRPVAADEPAPVTTELLVEFFDGALEAGRG